MATVAASHEEEALSKGGWCVFCLIAGFGGIAPPLSTLAKTFITDRRSPWPTPQYCVALVLFAVIGIAVALACSEGKRTLRQAFFMGVAAPGLITSALSGSEITLPRDDKGATPRSFITPAYGESTPVTALTASESSQAGLGIVLTFKGVQASQSDLPVSITFVSDKNSVLLKTTTTVGIPFKSGLPPGTGAVQLAAGTATLTIPVTGGASRSNVFAVNVEVKPANDFWWALGFKRELRISGLTLSMDRPPSDVDLSGVWAGKTGRVRITQQGSLVEGILEDVAPDSIKYYGMAKGEIALEGLLTGDTLSGKVYSYIPLTERAACPSLPKSIKADASLTLSADRRVLLGWREEVAIAGKCEVIKPKKVEYRIQRAS